MPIITRRRAKRAEVRMRQSGIIALDSRIPGRVFGSGPLRHGWSGDVLYSDTVLRCRNCDDLYEWTAEEQRVRHEVHHRAIYSYPAYCPECSHRWHRKMSLISEYDALVDAARTGRDLDKKRRVLALIGELYAAGVEPTGRMIYTQDVLIAQLAAAARRTGTAEAPVFPTRNGRPLGR